jgi:hypothetical protein
MTLSRMLFGRTSPMGFLAPSPQRAKLPVVSPNEQLGSGAGVTCQHGNRIHAKLLRVILALAHS